MDKEKETPTIQEEKKSYHKEESIGLYHNS